MKEWINLAVSFYTATESETTVLYITPTQHVAEKILSDLQTKFPLVRESIVEKSSGAIELENQSRIIARSAGDGGERLRGMHTDLVVTDTSLIDSEVSEKVIPPMLNVSHGTLIDTTW